MKISEKWILQILIEIWKCNWTFTVSKALIHACLFFVNCFANALGTYHIRLYRVCENSSSISKSKVLATDLRKWHQYLFHLILWNWNRNQINGKNIVCLTMSSLRTHTSPRSSYQSTDWLNDCKHRFNIKLPSIGIETRDEWWWWRRRWEEKHYGVGIGRDKHRAVVRI